MNNYKDFQELKSIKYTLTIFRFSDMEKPLYILRQRSETEQLFETESLIQMKMYLDLLGIDHFDELRMFPDKIALKISGYDKKYRDNIKKHTEFKLIKYYD